MIGGRKMSLVRSDLLVLSEYSLVFTSKGGSVVWDGYSRVFGRVYS